MEVRYEHYLREHKSNRWPGRIILVDTISSPRPAPMGRLVRTEGLKSWYMRVLVSRDSVYHLAAESAGTSVESFWTLLSELLAERTGTWLFSFEAVRNWHLLNLWGKLEDGTLQLRESEDEEPAAPLPTLCGADTDRSGQNGTGRKSVLRSVRRKTTGALIAQGKPAILIAGLGESRRRITWVDIQNYGIDRPAGLAAGPATIAWLEKTVNHMRRFARIYDLAALRATGPGWAYSSWRRTGLTDGVYCHCCLPALEAEEKALYGGRCEAFRLGKVPGEVVHLDFSSLYAYLAVNEAVPVRLVDVHDTNCDPAELSAELLARSIAKVKIDTTIPLFPLRCIGKVVYPIGRFSTWLAGPELLLGIVTDTITHVEKVVEYELTTELAKTASTFVSLRATARTEGNREIDQLSKSLYTGLVGRLAQRRRYWVHDRNAWCDLLWGEWLGTSKRGILTRFRSIGGQIEREENEGFAADAVPAIAAWIMAAGRIRLLQAIVAAGWDNVYYVDTDSLFVRKESVSSLQVAGLIKDGESGFLRILAAATDFEIRGIKYYYFAGKLTCAGLPAESIKDAGDGVHYWHDVSPLEQIRRRRKPSPESILAKYTRSPVYVHGVQHSDGTVTPYKFEEW